MIRVAILVPCYNEEDGIVHMVDSLSVQRKALRKKGIDIDVVLIDDGSIDRTKDVIGLLSKQYDFLFYRLLARNVGHQSALRSGLDASSDYDAVIMMDADMQHPPELIPKMIAKWQEGNKIVQMIRDDTPKEVGVVKYVTAMLYYKIVNSISSLNMEYGASDFRLIDKSVTEAVVSSHEKDLFLRGYFAWLPVKRTTISYRPGIRFAGKSKYTFRKMLDLATKGVLQFSEKPLQIAMNIGIFLALASFIYGATLVYGHFTGYYTVSGWTSLMVVVLFCFGINFVLLGIIGRYLAHSLSLLKHRPDYMISDEKLR